MHAVRTQMDELSRFQDVAVRFAVFSIVEGGDNGFERRRSVRCFAGVASRVGESLELIDRVDGLAGLWRVIGVESKQAFAPGPVLWSASCRCAARRHLHRLRLGFEQTFDASFGAGLGSLWLVLI